jgi:hypothetical protein
MEARLRPSGTYMVTISKNGREKWQRLVPAPMEDEIHEETNKPQTLQEAWMTGCRLSFEDFIAELTRENILTNDKLMLTGGQVKGCYLVLRDIGALPDLSMTEVYSLFTSAFHLKFRYERSLQTEKFDKDYFKDLFSFFVSDQNEIQNSNQSRHQRQI